jgi:type IV fimbrial biogenesis protein FimT
MEGMVMARSARVARGFTLTELMIALALAGILAMIGAPVMGHLLARTRDAGAVASIAGSLRHARAAAVMRNTRVLVCPSRDGRRCNPGDDWQHGWIVAEDSDHDGQPDMHVPLIIVQAATPAGTRIVTSTGRGLIDFRPSGSAGGSNARFTICHAHEREGKAVIVANSGRVRLADAKPERLHQCVAGLQ